MSPRKRAATTAQLMPRRSKPIRNSATTSSKITCFRNYLSAGYARFVARDPTCTSSFSAKSGVDAGPSPSAQNTTKSRRAKHLLAEIAAMKAIHGQYSTSQYPRVVPRTQAPNFSFLIGCRPTND